ncbi:MAG TPA: DUF4412 domain-containing protein [Puia sp.]|nr:DUF4412 domain-containing protein [Puia sp.]
MRLPFVCLLLAVTGPAAAQFNGKLVYQVDQKKSRTVMTYFQTGTSGKMEAYDISFKNGIPDSSTIKAQDTILYNFADSNETHLQYETRRAMKMRYLAITEAAMVASRMKGKTSTTVTANGPDTANGHKCMHFTISTTSALGTGIRDIWLTGDFGQGVSPSVWVVGAYLYYPPGSPHLLELLAKGAGGVVVKVVASSPHQGVIYTMNLMAIEQPRRYRAAEFSVPSGYTLVDRTGFTGN